MIVVFPYYARPTEMKQCQKMETNPCSLFCYSTVIMLCAKHMAAKSWRAVRRLPTHAIRANLQPWQQLTVFIVIEEEDQKIQSCCFVCGQCAMQRWHMQRQQCKMAMHIQKPCPPLSIIIQIILIKSFHGQCKYRHYTNKDIKCSGSIPIAAAGTTSNHQVHHFAHRTCMTNTLAI